MQADIELLKAFEKGLDPEKPQESAIPARVLGYGEISTIFEIQVESAKGMAFKRMPIFKTQNEVRDYEKLYHDYNAVLEKTIGIKVPPYGFVWFISDRGNIVAFDIQQKLKSESIGNRAIHFMDIDNVRKLFLAVLRDLNKLWDFNGENPQFAVGIDGQISNWSIADFAPSSPQITPDTRLVYIDTSTPLMKENGIERLDPELFLRSAPSFLLWLIRWLFLDSVMTRYYDARLVTIDLIANLYKEQRSDLVPPLVQAANDFFGGEGSTVGIKPLTTKEVNSYYREDAFIWTLFLAMRRFDRWLHKHILHRPYIYILPGHIKR